MRLVLNKHTDRIPPNAINIMRGTRWGNPYRIGPDGDRDQVIDKYRRYLWQQVQSGNIPLRDLAALADQPLVCCCKPKRCHGDVLAAAAKWAITRR